MIKMVENPSTELDPRGCVSLFSIIRSFHCPISEEHAWALCHETAKTAQHLIKNQNDIFIINSLQQLLIHKDGYIHPESFLDSTINNKGGSPRVKSTDQQQLISNLGTVIFLALDYGLSGDDERTISEELEYLLEAMVSADGCVAERSELTDDEGIERDSGDSDDDRNNTRSFNFNKIIHACCDRIGVGADVHYKNVCRAYVTEALELSTFLQKVSSPNKDNENYLSFGTATDAELQKLQFNDWARLWVQVIRDLRAGVKLKKVDLSTCGRIEYELTPYEILMDDIRSRRYKLNKVMVNGDLPRRIKKDAHNIILEFIRSRPPLKKAAERILGPAPTKDQTPIEKLLESIRQEHKLQPVPKKRTDLRRRAGSLRGMKSTESTSPKLKSPPPPPVEKRLPQRRIIKADINYLLDDDDKEEEFDFSDPEDGSSDPISGFYGHICPQQSQSTPNTPSKKLYDFHSKMVVGEMDKSRRHSIGNPSSRGEHSSTLITFPFEYTSVVQHPSASPLLARRTAKLPRTVSKSSLQEEFFQSNHWQTAMQCLSLNLEEVVHIRHVLTKAELESLPLECSLKEDVQKGKVCFLCLKTRFSLIFGPWGNICKLCKRTICSKCCSKMHIPTDHFASVPVSTLSPSISPREEEVKLPGSNSSLSVNRMTKNSSPVPSMKSDSDKKSDRSLSPSIHDPDDEERDTFNTQGHRSLPTLHSISTGIMAFKKRSFGGKTGDSFGGLMNVCHDCKAMVLQIIRSTRAKKAAALLKGGN